MDVGDVIKTGLDNDEQVETVALLSKLDVDKHISVKIELDLTSAESKTKYKQIKKMFCLNDRSAECTKNY